MNIPFLFLIISILFVIIGYVNTVEYKRQHELEVRIIPRNVYDEIILDQTLFQKNDLDKSFANS